MCIITIKVKVGGFWFPNPEADGDGEVTCFFNERFGADVPYGPVSIGGHVDAAVFVKGRRMVAIKDGSKGDKLGCVGRYVICVLLAVCS